MILETRFMNPFHKVLCVSCFKRFPAAEVHFRCENTSSVKCQEQQDDKQGRHLNPMWNDPEVAPPYLDRRVIIPDRSKILFKSAYVPQRVKCPTCHDPSTERCCPYCHSELPRDGEINGNQIIAILGLRNSGKSIYLAQLIERLREQSLARVGATLFPVTQATERIFKENYEIPILRGLQRPLSTAPLASNPHLRTPLVFRVSFTAKDNGVARGVERAAHLVFLEASGEDLETSPFPDLYRRYITAAGALVLLIDPLSIQALRKEVRAANLQSGQIDIPERFDKLLSNLFYSVFDQQGTQKMVQKPVAITISKSDLIRRVLRGESPPFFSPSEHIGGFDRQDSVEVSASIEEMLDRWGEKATLEVVRQRFENARFFAVSSLGADPQGPTFQEPNPQRVEDPIFWILNQWGLLRDK